MKERFYDISSLVNSTIALISDTHNTASERVIESLKKRHTDIIAVAGDFFMGYIPGNGKLLTDSQKNVLSLFEACVSIAPTYVSLGNHERKIGDEDISRIQKTGAIVVDNGWAVHDDLAIGGLTSVSVCNFRESRKGTKESHPHTPGNKKEIKPNTAWLNAFENSEGYRILLCHHPEYYPAYLCGRNIDLILSGHTHGGQIRLFGRGLYAPGQGWLPKYAGGVYDGKLVVSRGLANTAKPIPRLFNPVEVVYVKLSRDR